MPTNPTIEVGFTPFFLQALKRLKRKYRHAGSDVRSFVTRLENGELPGDQIPGVGYPVYKERLRNTDLEKGKSGGYRVVYYLRTSTAVVLLTIYVKSEQTDVAPELLKRLIEEYSAAKTHDEGETDE